MKYPDLLKSLRQSDYRPVYFLHGDEPYYIDQVTDYIEQHVLGESERAFNQTILYGRDADHLAVIDAARRYPMMAPRQVIIIKEAQDMKSLKELERYLASPVPTTLLVIAHKHKRFDKRTKFAKALAKHAVVFESKKLYDNKIAGWIANYLKDKGHTVQQGAADLMAEYLGNDLSRIANELDKMLLNVPAGAVIDAKAVEENIGISKDYNVFELQNALTQGDKVKATRIVNYFAANPRKHPLVVVLGTLYNYFSKIYIVNGALSGGKSASDQDLARMLGMSSAWFVKDYRAGARRFPRRKTEAALGILHEYDLRSKGVENVNFPQEELMREMVWKLLHV